MAEVRVCGQHGCCCRFALDKESVLEWMSGLGQVQVADTVERYGDGNGAHGSSMLGAMS